MLSLANNLGTNAWVGSTRRDKVRLRRVLANAIEKP